MKRRRWETGGDWAWTLEPNLALLKQFWQKVADQHPNYLDEPEPGLGAYAHFLLAWIERVERYLALRPSRQHTRIVAVDCLTIGRVHEEARTTFNLGWLTESGRRYQRMLNERRQSRAARANAKRARVIECASIIRHATPYDRSVHHTAWLAKATSKALKKAARPLAIPQETVRSLLRGRLK